MKYFTVLKFVFLVTIHVAILSGHAFSSNHDKAELIESAGFLLKKTARYIDTEIIDPAIMTFFTMGGAHVGNQASMFFLNLYFSKNKGIRINAQDRFEDDLGWCFGLYCGNQIGKFSVKLRHIITDPLFPALFNATFSVLEASKTYLEHKAHSMKEFLIRNVNVVQIKANNYYKTPS